MKVVINSELLDLAQYIRCQLNVLGFNEYTYKIKSGSHWVEGLKESAICRLMALFKMRGFSDNAIMGIFIHCASLYEICAERIDGDFEVAFSAKPILNLSKSNMNAGLANNITNAIPDQNNPFMPSSKSPAARPSMVLHTFQKLGPSISSPVLSVLNGIQCALKLDKNLPTCQLPEQLHRNVPLPPLSLDSSSSYEEDADCNIEFDLVFEEEFEDHCKNASNRKSIHFNGNNEQQKTNPDVSSSISSPRVSRCIPPHFRGVSVAPHPSAASPIVFYPQQRPRINFLSSSSSFPMNFCNSSHHTYLAPLDLFIGCLSISSTLFDDNDEAPTVNEMTCPLYSSCCVAPPSIPTNSNNNNNSNAKILNNDFPSSCNTEDQPSLTNFQSQKKKAYNVSSPALSFLRPADRVGSNISSELPFSLLVNMPKWLAAGNTVSTVNRARPDFESYSQMVTSVSTCVLHKFDFRICPLSLGVPKSGSWKLKLDLLEPEKAKCPNLYDWLRILAEDVDNVTSNPIPIASAVVNTLEQFLEWRCEHPLSSLKCLIHPFFLALSNSVSSTNAPDSISVTIVSAALSSWTRPLSMPLPTPKQPDTNILQPSAFPSSSCALEASPKSVEVTRSQQKAAENLLFAPNFDENDVFDDAMNEMHGGDSKCSIGAFISTDKPNLLNLSSMIAIRNNNVGSDELNCSPDGFCSSPNVAIGLSSYSNCFSFNNNLTTQNSVFGCGDVQQQMPSKSGIFVNHSRVASQITTTHASSLVSPSLHTLSSNPTCYSSSSAPKRELTRQPDSWASFAPFNIQDEDEKISDLMNNDTGFSILCQNKNAICHKNKASQKSNFMITPPRVIDSICRKSDHHSDNNSSSNINNFNNSRNSSSDIFSEEKTLSGCDQRLSLPQTADCVSSQQLNGVQMKCIMTDNICIGSPTIDPQKFSDVKSECDNNVDDVGGVNLLVHSLTNAKNSPNNNILLKKIEEMNNILVMTPTVSPSSISASNVQQTFSMIPATNTNHNSNLNGSNSQSYSNLEKLCEDFYCNGGGVDHLVEDMNQAHVDNIVFSNPSAITKLTTQFSNNDLQLLMLMDSDCDISSMSLLRHQQQSEDKILKLTPFNDMNNVMSTDNHVVSNNVKPMVKQFNANKSNSNINMNISSLNLSSHNQQHDAQLLDWCSLLKEY